MTTADDVRRLIDIKTLAELLGVEPSARPPPRRRSGGSRSSSAATTSASTLARSTPGSMRPAARSFGRHVPPGA